MRRRVQSFGHALRGIFLFFASGANAKLQLGCAFIALAAGWWLKYEPFEWIAITLCIGLVLSAEAMNSALEELANEVSCERRERIRTAKDIAAGAVLIASLVALAVGLIIVGRRL